MGNWGTGNLDSDGAMDELGRRSATLVTALLERARHNDSREFDEPFYDWLFVDFEILFALEACGLFTGAGVIHPEEAESLKHDFLDGYGSYCEENGERGRGGDRYHVISNTFDRFAKICAKYYRETI